LVLINGRFFPAFLVKAEANTFAFNSILRGNRSIYINRNAPQEARNAAVEAIMELQRKVEKDTDEPELLVYPEGT